MADFCPSLNPESTILNDRSWENQTFIKKAATRAALSMVAMRLADRMELPQLL